MSKCVKCGGEAAYHFRALEVQTLHVRDFTGESRVQALGNIQEFSVCASCAGEELERTLHPMRDTLKKSAFYLAVCIAGLVLTLLFFRGDHAFRILGPAAVICGLLGIYSTIQAAAKGRKSMEPLHKEDAEREAAWQTVLSQAPKKWEDSDLTYIPITQETLAMKNGDLMIAFDLLPDIAVKAHKLIHEGKEDHVEQKVLRS